MAEEKLEGRGGAADGSRNNVVVKVGFVYVALCVMCVASVCCFVPVRCAPVLAQV
jgi:hypothetical protein